MWVLIHQRFTLWNKKHLDNLSPKEIRLLFVYWTFMEAYYLCHIEHDID